MYAAEQEEWDTLKFRLMLWPADQSAATDVDDPGPNLVQGSVEHGFELPELTLGLLSETEFYGRSAGYDSRQPKKLASRRKTQVDPLQLTPGDFSPLHRLQHAVRFPHVHGEGAALLAARSIMSASSAPR